ncbi:MAG: protein-methionine-sulfoxide reductase catalytic subunit MsrP, partial [Gammaproteobacteria bacterium]
ETFMLIKKPDDIRPSEITPKDTYLNRRQFLSTGAAGALGLATAPLASQAGLLDYFRDDVKPTHGEKLDNVIPGPYSTTEMPNSFEDVASYNNFYEFGTDKGDPIRNSKDFKPRPWSIEIAGECAKPGSYDLEDFIAPHQLEERVYRFRCVEAWSMVVPWVGIPLGDMLKRFEPTSKAKYVYFETLLDSDRMPGQKRRIIPWPYVEGLRMDEAMNPLTLMVVGIYGEVLPNQNGAPLRLMVPWKYGFKSIKSIVKIHFVEKQPRNTWQIQAPKEYGFYANVNPKVDHPRWSQARERRIGSFGKIDTLPFNGYGEQVAQLYKGMDLAKHF